MGFQSGPKLRLMIPVITRGTLLLEIPTRKRMVLEKRPERELEEECLRVGMRNLRQSCFMKLLDGLTTLEEAVSLFYEDF